MPASPRRPRPRRRSRPREDPEPGLRGSDVERKLDAKLLKEGYWFDYAEADRVCYFFEKVLVHGAGEWQGQKMALAMWQRERLRRLFGWRRPDGTRRYRRSQWWIPKKNGKSLIASGIALYLLAFDGELGAQVYAAAGNKDQARMVFDEAVYMVESSPDLDRMIQCFKDSVFYPASRSKFVVLTGKAPTKHGLNVSGLVVDEVHEFKDHKLYAFLSNGTVSRRQPLEVVISTAGDNVGGFGYELWQYAVKVRDGIFDDPDCMVVIYAADPDDRWDDERVWAKANPNLGVSPKLEDLRSKAVECRGRPSKIPEFRRLFLNIWTQAEKAWISIDRWKALPRCPRELIKYRGRRCWGGLDLSKTTDLTALVLVFEPEQGGDVFDVLPFFWCPADNAAERGRIDGVMYPLWIEQGFIRATEGNIVDYRAVRRDIARLCKILDVQEVAFDRKYATGMVQDLQDEDDVTMVEHGQGFLDMSPPSLEFERRVLGGLLAHPDHPVLTWNVSNMVVKRDPAGGIKPDKSKSQERIDGGVALVMGVGRATLGVQAGKSVYDDRGLLEL